MSRDLRQWGDYYAHMPLETHIRFSPYAIGRGLRLTIWQLSDRVLFG